jgi:hypothetical protein
MDAQLQAAVQDRDALSSYSNSLDAQGQVAEEPETGAIDARGVDLFDTGKVQKVEEEETPLR